MKKQLSLALLTLNIFGLNALPARATTIQVSQTSVNNTESIESKEYAFFTDGEWCVELPWMGLICW